MSAFLANPILYWGAAAAVVLAAAAGQAHRDGLDPWTMYLSGVVGFAGALLLGGSLAPLVSSGEAHEASTGRGALGALLGAGLGGWGVLKLRGSHFLAYADAAAPAVALGYGVYRIGCLLNGCCFGTAADLPWAVGFGVDSEAFSVQIAAGSIAPDATQTLPTHPTQIYHALLGLAGFLVLRRRPAGAMGRRFAAALMIYGAGRFAIEFFRGDAVAILGPLDPNHIAALGMLGLGIFLWRRRSAAVDTSRLTRTA